MQGNRSRDTKPEMAVRSAVHRRGIRFRVSARPQPEIARTADLVLRKTRIAVFVDGCYWHGCPDHHTQPATNAQYWADKIARNVERDSETTAYLQQAGWTVLRFWEHEDPEAVADQVQEAVHSALASARDSRGKPGWGPPLGRVSRLQSRCDPIGQETDGPGCEE
ncbi:MAG: very short patch repair endonuclease [Acidimicrobiaceae bacterium]|nr:very short patch repair endonuclease [Acidimicrobiaceae bacterium]